MSGAVAALQAQRDLRLGRVGGELVGLDRLGAQLGEVGPGQRDPGRLDDPAPVGVAPVERGLTRGELAIALAVRSASSASAAPVTSILPTRVAPSPSATTSSASCSRTASSSPGGSGRPAVPLA